jgi:hypothetical protein
MQNIKIMEKPLFIAMWVFDGNQLVMNIAYITMLRVNAHFKWMKDHILFEMGEKMATQLKMDFLQSWDVNRSFLYAH